MIKAVLRTAAAIAVLVMLAACLSSCSVSDLLNRNDEKPVEVSVKTDLKDPVFSFSYAQLREVLSADVVASVFEDYDEIKDDTTVELSYNDMSNLFEKSDADDGFKKLMDICTEEEIKALSANSHEVLEYFNEHINSVKKEKPVVDFSEGFWTDGDSFKFTQNGNESPSEIADAAKYFDYFVTKGVGEYFGNKDNGRSGTTAKGDSLDGIMYLYGEDTVSRLGDEDCVSVISSLMYDTQKVSEQYTDENGKTAKRDVKVVTGITRIIKITLKDDPESVSKAFSLQDKQQILDEMSKAKDYFTVEDYDTDFNGCTIVATFNAVTDNILSAAYDKKMSISADIVGTGSLEHIGRQNVRFDCTRWVNYRFGWDAEAK